MYRLFIIHYIPVHVIKMSVPRTSSNDLFNKSTNIRLHYLLLIPTYTTMHHMLNYTDII